MHYVGICVCPSQLCYISARSDKELFQVMLVSGRSSLHHHWCRQNEEGSCSHLQLGKCLLISAKMPGCFLIHILQRTAVAHLLIIQEESCGYLMLCCRDVSIFPALHSCLFAPLHLLPAACCIVCYSLLPLCFLVLFWDFFQKRKCFCSIALQPKVNKNVSMCVWMCMLEAMHTCHASGDFTVLSS